MDEERLNLPSASSAATWMACQGQPQMVRSLPPRDESADSSPEASRGTKIHAALEHRNPLELDESEAFAYQQALRNQDIAIQQWQSELGLELVAEGERELRLWLHSQDGKEALVSGKMDAHFIEQGTRQPCVIVEDFKSGAAIGAAPASTNAQLRTLAVLVKWEYGARHVRVLVNRFEAFGNQIDVCDYDEAALSQAEYMVRFHLWLTTLPGAQRTPGPHCWFCAAVGLCPENAAWTMLPTVASGGILERVDTLSPQDLRRLWDVDSQIRKTLDRVSYRLSKLPEETLASIGLRLGAPKQSESIVDVAGAKAKLQSLGLAEADLLTRLSFGKGALVELIRREFALSSDVKAEAWLTANIGEFIETAIGTSSLKEIKT